MASRHARTAVVLAALLTALAVAAAFRGDLGAVPPSNPASATESVDPPAWELPEVQTSEEGLDGGETSEPSSPQGSTSSTLGHCPGAPPSGGGMERRPDTARDADGVLHMVWQERFGGQFDICYARQPGELGLGSDDNPAWRVSRTPHPSLASHIAIDAASGVAYVVWTEVLPPHIDGWYSPAPAPLPTAVRLYSSTEITRAGDPLWTHPLALPDGACGIRAFEVYASAWTLESRPGRGEWASEAGAPKSPDLNCSGKGSELTREGVFDTDDDAISDAEEILGTLAKPTRYDDEDTDDDALPDDFEIAHALDPTLEVWVEFPGCFRTASIDGYIGKLCPALEVPMLDFLCYLVDPDGDGFGFCAEGEDYPVTTEVGLFTHGGWATYRFWPKVDGLYNVVLRTEQRTYVAGGCAGLTVAVAVQVDGVAAGTFTWTWDDSNPPWTVETVATATVSGVDFTAVTASMAVDVRLDVTFDPAPCGTAVFSPLRQLALDWIKLELAADRSEVNYKDADDTLATATGKFAFTFVTEDLVIQLDPEQRDLLMELDSMVNHAFERVVLNEMINAFSDENIILNYKVDETGLSESGASAILDLDPVDNAGPDWSMDETSLYLAAHKNPALPSYVHVVNARHLNFDYCGIAEQGEVGDTAIVAGIIVEDQRLMDFDCSTVSLTLTQWRLVVFLHEFMHVLGAAHEENAADGGAPDPIIDPTGVDICNGYNIMVGGGYCGGSAVVIPQEVYGTGNDDRRFGATEAIAGPRCSIECTAQFDFSYLLSVRTSNNMDRLDDVV